MAGTEQGDARFEIGAVISRAFETIGSNLLLFFGLSLVLAGIPQFVIQFWQFSNFGMNMGIGGNPYALTGTYWTTVLVAMLAGWVTNAVLQAALTRATVLHLSGEPPEFGPCLAIGFRLILPMIAIGLLAGIGLMFGFLFLIVPGIVLWTVWAVITPAYVQEKIGIFEAFGRSATLTSGSRWRILLVGVIVAVMLWAIGIPFTFLTTMLRQISDPILLALLTAVLGALRSMIIVAVTASTYVELRQLKDGVAPNELEAIFA